MTKKRSSGTPIIDLVRKLMSTQMSMSDILATAEQIEGDATKARASTPQDRQRWAEQKKRQRGMSRVDSSAAISSSESVGSDSERKKDSGDSNVHVDKPRRSVGGCIPDDWEPSPDDLAYGTDNLSLFLREVQGCGEEMKLWAQANRNRAVARKADWSLTFKGWMRRAAPQIIRNRPRGGGSPNGAPNGSQQRPPGFSGLAARIRGNPDGRPAPEDLQPINRR